MKAGPIRDNFYVRAVAQMLLIATLIAVVFAVTNLRDDVDQQTVTTDTLAALLNDACDAAPQADLRRKGIVGECQLARTGDLRDRIAADDVPDDLADVVPDDSVTIDPLMISEAVEDYFEANPLAASPDYEASITRATERYLRANPPRDVTIPQADIRAAVRTVLLANPPADGEAGTPGESGAPGDPGAPGEPGQAGGAGRGIAVATTDGCDVVFTYSDDTTDRLGPFCGPKGDPGPAPTQDQIATAVAAYCTANGECRGPAGVVAVNDACTVEPGQIIRDVGIAYDPASQTVTLTCDTVGVP